MATECICHDLLVAGDGVRSKCGIHCRYFSTHWGSGVCQRTYMFQLCLMNICALQLHIVEPMLLAPHVQLHAAAQCQKPCEVFSPEMISVPGNVSHGALQVCAREGPKCRPCAQHAHVLRVLEQVSLTILYHLWVCWYTQMFHSRCIPLCHHRFVPGEDKRTSRNSCRHAVGW